MQKSLLLLFVALCVTTLIFAQNGSISGVVTNGETGEPVFGSRVYVDGTSYGGISMKAGDYKIMNVKPGTYSVTCSFVLLGTKTIDEIVVKAGENTTLDIELGKTVIRNVGTTVHVHIDHGSETAALNEMKEETKVVEIVSSKEMSAKGDNTASSAAKRVSGVSVIDGKYVYVRGLSDRYTKTMLNGSEVPGMDPDKNSVQLDIFPSSFIESMKVIKTFTPDLPGDFTGGLVNIRTKEYTDSLQISVGGSMGYNTQSSFRSDFISGKKGPTDFLGMDNGDRRWSDYVIKTSDNNESVPPGFQVLDQYRETYDLTAKGFDHSNLQPTNSNSFTNHSLTLTASNSKKWKRKSDTLKTRTLGYFGGINYRRSYSFYEGGEIGVYDLTGTIETVDELTASRKFDRTKSNDAVLLGGVLNLTYKLSDSSSIGLNLMRTQSGSHEASRSLGFRDDDPSRIFRSQSIVYTQRALNSAQLHGEHQLTKVKVDWLSGLALSSQDQPDMVFYNDDFQVENGDTNWRIQPAVYKVPARLSRSMSQVNTDTKINFNIPVEMWDSTTLKLKTGLSHTLRSRVFQEKRFDYNLNTADYDGSIGDLVDQGQIGYLGQDADSRNVYGVGLTEFEDSKERNTYTGLQNILGAYVMGEKSLTKRLDFIGGVRYEYTNLIVESADTKVEKGELVNHDLLPSANLIFKIWDGKKVTIKKDSLQRSRDMKLRASYNRTLARPSFREIAPFFYEDFERGLRTIGNPDLKRTIIHNFDLRWEYYPKPGELLSVSGFFKQFINPIEIVQNPLDDNFYYANVTINPEEGKNYTASLFGVEIEFRRSLEFISEQLKNFKFGGNTSFTTSSVELDPATLFRIHATDQYRENTRPFFGQSPYLVNLFLGYDSDSLGLKVNATYNVFGKRLAVASGTGAPNIFEMPRNVLDINIEKKFGEKLTITLRARNLLNPDYALKYVYEGDNAVYDKFENQDYYYSRYTKGRSFSLGLKYKF